MTRPHLVLVFLGACAVTACQREERMFQQPPAAASTANAIVQSKLRPGESPAPRPLKNPYEENAYAMSEGKRLFTWYNCVGCHGHGGGSIGPPLMDDKWIYGSEPANIFATIVEGRPNGMPSFRGRIPDYEVWELVAYVRSMGRLVPMDAAPGRDDGMQTGEPEQMRDKQKPKASGVPPSAEH